MKIAKYIVATIFLALLVADSYAAPDRKGVKREVRNVANFSKIAVSSSIDVYITQGSQFHVEVEADENVVDKIVTKLDGETLVVKFDSGLKRSWNNIKVMKVHITVPTIDAIKASGSSDVYLDGTLKVAGTFNLTISGSSDFKKGTVDAKAVKIAASGSSDCYMTINASTVDVTASGSSDCNLTVNAQELAVSVSGSSDINLSGTVETITAKASGSSDIKGKGFTYQHSDVHSSSSSSIKLKN